MAREVFAVSLSCFRGFVWRFRRVGGRARICVAREGVSLAMVECARRRPRRDGRSPLLTKAGRRAVRKARRAAPIAGA